RAPSSRARQAARPRWPAPARVRRARRRLPQRRRGRQGAEPAGRVVRWRDTSCVSSSVRQPPRHVDHEHLASDDSESIPSPRAATRIPADATSRGDGRGTAVFGGECGRTALAMTVIAHRRVRTSLVFALTAALAVLVPAYAHTGSMAFWKVTVDRQEATSQIIVSLADFGWTPDVLTTPEHGGAMTEQRRMAIGRELLRYFHVIENGRP